MIRWLQRYKCYRIRRGHGGNGKEIRKGQHPGGGREYDKKALGHSPFKRMWADSRKHGGTLPEAEPGRKETGRGGSDYHVGDAVDGDEGALLVADFDLHDVGALATVEEAATGGDVGALRLAHVVAVDFDAENAGALAGGLEDGAQGSGDGFRQRHVRAAVEFAVGTAGAAVDGHAGFEPVVADGGINDAQMVDEGVAAKVVQFLEDFFFHGISICNVFTARNNTHIYVNFCKYSFNLFFE